MQALSVVRLPDSLASVESTKLAGDTVFVQFGVAYLCYMLDAAVEESVGAQGVQDPAAAQLPAEQAAPAPATLARPEQAAPKQSKAPKAEKQSKTPKAPNTPRGTPSTKVTLEKWTEFAATVSNTSAAWPNELKSAFKSNKQLWHQTKNFPKTVIGKRRFQHNMCQFLAGADVPHGQKEAVVKVMLKLEVPFVLAELAYVSKVCSHNMD